MLIYEASVLKELRYLFAVYGRLSADEFCILISKKNYNKKEFLDCIKAIQDKFSNQLYHMHIYGGIYEIKNHKESVAAMCEKIRIAIDEIKGNYDSNLAYYDDRLLKESMIKRKIVGEFDEALASNQFCIYLQPQVIDNDNILGAEALVRWIHPEKGIISPGQFIPVLEDTGLISRLDLFVWDQAARLLRKWKEEGRDSTYISVNVSAKDFYHIDIYDTFTGLVEKYGIAPSNLKIEITETVLMNEAKNQMKMLQQLRDYGFEIEIDDFGSGYSSLNMLKDIIVDVLKIDMGFLEETENKKRSWSIIQSIANLAQILGMKTVTEGVETEFQVDHLRDMGCNVFQGYYFAKPMPVDAFTEKYFK